MMVIVIDRLFDYMDLNSWTKVLSVLIVRELDKEQGL